MNMLVIQRVMWLKPGSGRSVEQEPTKKFGATAGLELPSH